MLRSNLCQVGRTVTSNDEKIFVHLQILAISTAYVQSYCAWCSRGQEVLDYRPRLVSRGREVTGDLFVDFVHVLRFILGCIYTRDI